MENNTPRCSLAIIRAKINAGEIRTTRTVRDLAGCVSPHTPAGEVYLKLTVIDDVLVVSFKEL